MNLEQEVAILRRELDDIIVTVKSLVSRTGELEKTLAVINQNIIYIKDGQDRVYRILSKILWGGVSLVLTTLGSAFLAWVIRGGMAQ